MKAFESSEETKEVYKEILINKIKEIVETKDLNAKWKIVTETLVRTTEEILPKVRQKEKLQWMTLVRHFKPHGSKKKGRIYQVLMKLRRKQKPGFSVL